MKVKKQVPPPVATPEVGSPEYIVGQMRAIVNQVHTMKKERDRLLQEAAVIKWDIERLENDYKKLQNELDLALSKEVTPPQTPVA